MTGHDQGPGYSSRELSWGELLLVLLFAALILAAFVVLLW
jgi:hypothetical protein